MTTRVKSLTVVLDKDMRDDDVQEIIKAVEMVKGVSLCIIQPTDVFSLEDELARMRVKRELAEKLYEVLK